MLFNSALSKSIDEKLSPTNDVDVKFRTAEPFFKAVKEGRNKSQTISHRKPTHVKTKMQLEEERRHNESPGFQFHTPAENLPDIRH